MRPIFATDIGICIKLRTKNKSSEDSVIIEAMSPPLGKFYFTLLSGEVIFI